MSKVVLRAKELIYIVDSSETLEQHRAIERRIKKWKSKDVKVQYIFNKIDYRSFDKTSNCDMFDI